MGLHLGLESSQGPPGWGRFCFQAHTVVVAMWPHRRAADNMAGGFINMSKQREKERERERIIEARPSYNQITEATSCHLPYFIGKK